MDTADFRKKGRKRQPKSKRNEIGETLAERRIEQGWTLEEAGRESGISFRIIAKLEKGQHDTSIANLERYLNFYGLTLATRTKESVTPETRPSTEGLDKKGLPKW